MFASLDVSASGLAAQRVRQDTIALNVASAGITRAGVDASGRPVPYRRQFPIVAPATDRRGRPAGVKVVSIETDLSEGDLRYEPGHVDAGPDGYVRYPNVDLATEFANMVEATRAYEANITAMEATKAMLSASLRLLA